MPASATASSRRVVDHEPGSEGLRRHRKRAGRLRKMAISSAFCRTQHGPCLMVCGLRKNGKTKAVAAASSKSGSFRVGHSRVSHLSRRCPARSSCAVWCRSRRTKLPDATPPGPSQQPERKESQPPSRRKRTWSRTDSFATRTNLLPGLPLETTIWRVERASPTRETNV
jgi:hypothetical protein